MVNILRKCNFTLLAYYAFDFDVSTGICWYLIWGVHSIPSYHFPFPIHLTIDLDRHTYSYIYLHMIINDFAIILYF